MHFMGISSACRESLLHTCISILLIFYREDEQERGESFERFQPQPIPDFVRWFETEELHYLSIKKAKEITSSLPDLSAKSELFLPSKLLDTILRITEEV